MSGISERLQVVRERIDRAAREAGRRPEQVRLLAVSKTKPIEDIREAYRAGQRDFGENYLQELVRKAEALRELSELRWHMIGHVQTNKAKLAASAASVVHTVDSARIARALGRRRAQQLEANASSGMAARRLEVLIEVNVGGEAQKAGCSTDDLEIVARAIEGEPALELRGLMTVPPHSERASEALPYFERLRALRDAHGGSARLPELSMGMSHDLEVAIRAGATIVRVGTAIFGARSPRPASP